MSITRTRTLLIDDSAFMRKVIGDIIRNDDSLELVGIANDGQRGTDLALELKPDVVITDMVMPERDGMYVVQTIMEKYPTPIILLSSLEKTNVRIFDALQYGAFEFIDKPADMESVRAGSYPLVELIKEAARTDITILKARQLAKKNSHAHTFTQSVNYDIIVIGASTGGPGAVEWVINNMPKNLMIPVIIVQHMPARFLETFALRLSHGSPLPVKLAHRGEPVKGGTIYITPGDTNTRIEINVITGSHIFTSTMQKYDEYNFPSVDCLFESVAEIYGGRSIGVILTGMGKDGANGLSKIRNNGGFTIAQDEESSVVYGMPKAAADRGAVKQIVKLKEIPGFLVSCL